MTDRILSAHTVVRSFATVSLILALGLLQGCPSDSDTAPATAIAQTAAFHGTVYGGRQPVSGATVGAYEAASGTAAPLIATATTGQNGRFTMDISSASPDAIIYVVAAGGNSQGYAPSSTTVNGAIKLVTVAGAYCDSTATGCSFPDTVQMNELTTAATAYSMAGFIDLDSMPGTVNILGGPPGLPNAAGTFANLVDAESGQAVIPGATGCTDPDSEPANCAALRMLNTLANIAAACVNAAAADSDSCSALFIQATPESGTAPADVFTALFNVATDAGGVRNDASGIYALGSTTAIFAPTLTAAPHAWTLALNHPDDRLRNPTGIAVDAAGNVWIADYYFDLSYTYPICKFSNDGNLTACYHDDQYDKPYRIAVDAADHVWVSNPSNNHISRFDVNGNQDSNFPAGERLSSPYAIAVDSGNNAWVANGQYNSSYGYVLSKFDQSGLGSHFTGGGLTEAAAVAIDQNDNVWIANLGAANGTDYDISKFDNGGNPLSPDDGYTGGGLDEPGGIAVDGNGNVWVVNKSPHDGTHYGISKFSNSGTPLSPSDGYTGGGLDNPCVGIGNDNLACGIAVDAAGNVWVVSKSPHDGAHYDISEFDNNGNPLSPSDGYTGGGLLYPHFIAVDSSGNVWVTNDFNKSITEFIGIAAPTRTPIISAIANGFTPDE